MSEIITAGNPILKAVAAPVTSFDKKLKFLILDMKKTLYEANGVGLAAPQIAVSKRIFVADDGESGFEAYINPEWQPDGDEMATDVGGWSLRAGPFRGSDALCTCHRPLSGHPR